jgi:hypothetical protein
LKWRRVLKKHGPCPATGPDGRERKKGGIGGERRKRIERGGAYSKLLKSKYWNERGSVSSSKHFAWFLFLVF